MELVISRPTDDMFLKAIDFNYEELKGELINSLQKYEGLTYTENEIRDAKADRATLNRFKKALDDKRMEVKRKILEPYDAFEVKIKDLLSLVDKPILAIDGQVKEFENKVKAEKKISIETFFNDNVGDLKDLVPFSKLYSEKWLNATAKLADVQEEIAGKLSTIKKDLDVIGTLQSEFLVTVKGYYLSTFDLSGALAEKARLEKVNADLKALAEKTKEKEVQVQIAVPQEVAKETIPEPLPVAEQEQIIDFRVWATQTQLNKLKEFLTVNNIKYGKAGN